ncbi:MAG: NifU family protein [Myxococcota bacterium]
MSSSAPLAAEEPVFGRLVAELERLETVVEGWEEPNQQATVTALRTTVEQIQAAAFRSIIRTVKGQPGGMEALKVALDDEIVVNVLRYHGILRAPSEPSLEERVEAALEQVRPMLAQHDGDVELVAVELPVVRIRMLGSCDGCAFSDQTVKLGVEKAVLDAVPEASEVRVEAGGGHTPQLVPVGRLRGSDRRAGDVTRSPFDVPWVRVCDVEAVEEESVAAFETEQASVLVARVGGKLKAYPNACTHLGMPLDGGDVVEGVITCPFHGFAYKLSSGECLTAPDVALPPYPTKVEDGGLFIQVTV